MKAPFGPSRKIEQFYAEGIAKLLRGEMPKLKKDQSFADWIQQLQALSLRHLKVDNLARSMVRWANIENAKSWKEASARSQHSRMLYRLLQKELQGPLGARYQQIVHQNAMQIQSIPQDIAVRLGNHLAKAQEQGLRHEAIAQVMREQFKDLAEWKVTQLARTGVASAASALTQAKSEEVGIPCYVWDTSKDQRVRLSHRKMDGVIVFWNDAPSPEALIGQKSSLGHYNAGQTVNCRCGAQPLLSLDDVSWPHRVYRNGSITRMTRAQFRNIAGLQERIDRDAIPSLALAT